MISQATRQTEQPASTDIARRIIRAIGVDALMNVSHDEIACRAYDIYMRSAMVDGHDTRHWYQAEYELRRQRIRDALMSETATTVSRDERYSEILNGRNPRADAKLIRAVTQATPGKARRGRPESHPTPHVEIPSTQEARLDQGSSP